MTNKKSESGFLALAQSGMTKQKVIGAGRVFGCRADMVG